MPLMPATRPVNSINNTAERPISPPPIAAETGVKLVMTLPRDAADAQNDMCIGMSIVLTRRQPSGRRRGFAQITSAQRGVLAEHDAWQVHGDVAIFTARGDNGMHL